MTFSLRPEPDIRVEATLSGAIKAIVVPEPPARQPHRPGLVDLQPYPLALPTPDTTIRQLFDICCGVQACPSSRCW